MVKTLIVAGKIIELAKTKEGKALNVSSKLADALTKKVESIIERACERAVENGRTTVMCRDL